VKTILIAIMALMLCTVVAGMAVIAGVRFRAPESCRPTSPAKTTVTQGPPVLSVAKMTELVTLKVNMITSLEAQNNWYAGAWLLAGDALIGTDCTKMEMTSIDHDRNSFTMLLPEPRVIACRVNHEHTKTLSLQSTSWNPFQLINGNKDEIREAAMKQAQRKMEICASSEEYIQQAKEQAETALWQLYAELGWKLTIQWRQGPHHESSGPATADADGQDASVAPRSPQTYTR
jgi:hypothetical protein